VSYLTVNRGTPNRETPIDVLHPSGANIGGGANRKHWGNIRYVLLRRVIPPPVGIWLQPVGIWLQPGNCAKYKFFLCVCCVLVRCVWVFAGCVCVLETEFFLI